MEDNNVDILLSVDLDPKETLRSIAELRVETEGLREDQKKLDKTTAEGRAEYERLNTQIKANTKTIQQYEKQVVNTLVQEKAQEGSIKSMRAELSNLKAAYDGLSKADREGAKGRALLDKTAALNAELKELEAAYGDNQRKVGEYENAGKSLRTELGEITNELMKLASEGRQNSEVYQELFEKATQLKNAQNEVNQSIGNSSKNTAAFDATLQGVQAVTASYGLWKSAAAAVGVENETIDKTLRNLTIVMTAIQSLSALQVAAQRQSILYQKAANILQKLGIKQTAAEVVATSANVVATKAEAAAENASNAAKAKGVVVTGLLAAKQWLWNAAMSANPVMIIVIAIMALIAGIAALIGWMTRESKSARDAAAAQEAYNAAVEESETRLQKLENAHKNSVRERNLASRQLIEQMKAEGKTQEEIDGAKRKSETDLRNLEIEYQKQKQGEAEDLIALKQKELKLWPTSQKFVAQGGKRWQKYADQIKEAEAALVDLKATLDDANYSVLETQQDQIEADREAAEAAKKYAKEKADAAEKALTDSIARYEKELDAQKKYNEAMLKAEKGYQSSDLKTRQDYARKLFDLNASTEKAKLDNLRKNNRITEAEYNQSLGIMRAQLEEFSNGQVSELNKYFEGERAAILGMLAKTLDEQIAEAEKKYADALKKLESIEPPDPKGFATEEQYAAALAEYETFMLEQINIAIRLENQKNTEVENIRKSALAAQAKQIEDGLKDAYAADLAAYQNNERAKLDMTEKMLREQIAAKKAAGIETYNEEAQLENIRLQRIGLDLSKEMLLAGDSAKKKYEAKKKALEAELEVYAGNADVELQIARELADAERELFNERIAAVQDWANAAGDLLNGVFDLMNARTDAELAKVQETYDKESEALKNRYDKGLMTEQEYNRQAKKLEEQKEKETAKLERQKAIRERASKVFSVVTDTAMGVVKTLGQMGIPAGIPSAAIMTAIGALNLATILAEPLPKAARGGLVVGPKHSAGGTVIEAEGGEAIMNAKTVSMFGPVLSALNQLGGGVPFAGPLSDGGYMLRHASTDRPTTAEEIAEAMKNVRIFTLIDDVNRGQEQFAKIQTGGDLM